MPVDVATQQLLAQLAQNPSPALHEMTPDAARQLTAAGAALAGPGPHVHRVVNEEIPTSDGASIRARVLVPTARPDAVFVYFHGGGWVIGAIEEFDRLGRELAVATNAAVVLVDYRLAPEHPFPTPVQDAWEAMQWVARRVKDLAGGDVPLLVGGDSAGGNLAAVVARRARDAGGPSLAAQVLVYPVTDHDLQTGSYLDPENQLLLNRDSMVWFWDHYLPDPAGRDDPDASPLRAADLAGVPPALVATGEYDVLRDEGEAYADRLEAAGVPVIRRQFAGQTHGFFTMVGILPASGEAQQWIASGLARVLS